ncbi:MAG: DUF5677 domain-containing protein [Gallionella sp.]
MMYSQERISEPKLVERYGDEVSSFLVSLQSEIDPFRQLVDGLFLEHSTFLSLFQSRTFEVTKESQPVEVIDYVLLLKQFELGNQAVRSLIQSDYMVCATLVRSMFETNMTFIYLSKHPDDADDFIAFSEIIGNPDVDWVSHRISRTKRENLEKKFSIRKMIKQLYAGTDHKETRINTEHFYQQLCNITHPSLEPVEIFYKAAFPPERAFSNIGIRRTVTQLFSMLNQTVETLAGGVHKNKQELENSYKRREEMYRLHAEATEWHKNNPAATPPFTRNEEFRIGWKGDKAVIVFNEA